MAVQQRIWLGQFPSLIIPAKQAYSLEIDFSLDFDITNNDSIKIIKFILSPSAPLVSPSMWWAIISYYSSDLETQTFDWGMGTTSDPIIQVSIDNLFSLNHKQYTLYLAMKDYTLNTHSQDVGIFSTFDVNVDVEMTINTKPTVTPGKIITPFEMVKLAAYKNIVWNYSNETINASDGNKIKSNTLSAGTPITAAWYNS